jgi:hypothetical protein
MQIERRVMLWRADHGRPLGKLSGAIDRAEAPTAALMADVILGTGTDLTALPSSDNATRHRRLIEAEAWTDAALALLATALPDWSLVRLACDDGEWCCTLARHWQLPDWLDDTVETRHTALPLAILATVVEAIAADIDTRRDMSGAGQRSAVPVCRGAADDAAQALCCDNFI